MAQDSAVNSNLFSMPSDYNSIKKHSAILSKIVYYKIMISYAIKGQGAMTAMVSNARDPENLYFKSENPTCNHIKYTLGLNIQLKVLINP